MSTALNGSYIDLGHDSFDAVAGVASSGDLVYFDPPYAPPNAPRGSRPILPGFTDAGQEKLQRLVLELAARGCHVVVSNASAPPITDGYGSRTAREAGLRIHRVAARRAINSDAGRCGQIQKFIISNVNPR